jgi:peptidoglycan/xylan/chitin deacetylase (PgdA/CDA1 family)
MPLAPAWYIVLYHDISWEENCYLRSIGGTVPPDIFRDHVRALASVGELVSIPEGERRLREHTIDVPLFSFWFDDGLAGVSRHAAPILEEHGVAAAVSICSRFVRHAELFWRFKLSYLNAVDGIRFLRSRLSRRGFKRGDSVKTFTRLQFSADVLADIDELFERFTTPQQRADAFRMFMDRGTIERLWRRGWTIANHTAAHYPVCEPNCFHLLPDTFREGDEEVVSICGKPSTYWVLPFDTESPAAVIDASTPWREDRHLVFVRNRANTPASCGEARVLYRFSAPIGSARQLIGLLER